jgi:chemotaxis response regulator CheB
LYEVIVIGTSWGGLDALSRLLDGMHDDVHQPIVIAQHRSPESEEDVLPRLLDAGYRFVQP